MTTVLTGYNASATTWAFIRTNTYLGLLGDGAITFKLTINASGKQAGLLLRATGSPSAFDSAILIDLTAHATAPVVSFSKIIAGTRTLLYATPSMVPIPVSVQLRVTIIANAGKFSIYINDLLAAVFWDTSVAVQGGIGFAVYGNNAGGSVASFDDLRVADVWKGRDYFAAEPKTSVQQALQSLIDKDRIAYFMRSTGALRLSTFSKRTVADTYTDTVLEGTLRDSDRYWVSQVQPNGSGVADRFDPTLLASDGRRLKVENYGDTGSDEQAYDDAGVPLRLAREQSRQYTLKSTAVPGSEPEDLIAITNPLDGVTAENFIINDLETTYDLDDEGNPTFDQTTSLRVFVS